MIDGIRIKVCGLTTLVDAEFADKCGIDYIAFNLHPASPRFVPLDQYRAMAPREVFLDQVKRCTPLGREQTPEDIGRLVVFLASEASGYITSRTFHVDGGNCHYDR